MTYYAPIQTVHGHSIDPMNILPTDINIHDIAHALSMQCRYNGHLRRFYSVAEHCVLVSQMVPKKDQLWGLLHDAAEAYIGDIITPVKVKLNDYIDMEEAIMAQIAAKYGLCADMPESVHKADKYLLTLECEWRDAGCPSDLHGIRGLNPSAAETLFINTFRGLDKPRPKIHLAA